MARANARQVNDLLSGAAAPRSAADLNALYGAGTLTPEQYTEQITELRANQAANSLPATPGILPASPSGSTPSGNIGFPTPSTPISATPSATPSSVPSLGSVSIPSLNTSLFTTSGAAAGTNYGENALQALIHTRAALAGSAVNDLQTLGTGRVAGLRNTVQELGTAAQVAQGAFGEDLGSDFTAALRDAAAARGLDPGSISPFDAGLGSLAFQDKASQLSTRTGFEDLLYAGFAPPQNVNLATVGQLQIQGAELAAQVQAGISQSLQSSAMFSAALQGLL